jgi:hypothetical protein
MTQRHLGNAVRPYGNGHASGDVAFAGRGPFEFERDELPIDIADGFTVKLVPSGTAETERGGGSTIRTSPPRMMASSLMPRSGPTMTELRMARLLGYSRAGAQRSNWVVTAWSFSTV